MDLVSAAGAGIKLFPKKGVQLEPERRRATGTVKARFRRRTGYQGRIGAVRSSKRGGGGEGLGPVVEHSRCFQTSVPRGGIRPTNGIQEPGGGGG